MLKTIKVKQSGFISMLQEVVNEIDKLEKENPYRELGTLTDAYIDSWDLACFVYDHYKEPI